MKNRTLILLPLVAVVTTTLWADDGIWLPNQFPKNRVRERYGLDVKDEFLDHLRLSSVRLNNGGSGSFVSPDGLLFTNHHVASDCIQQLSSKENDWMKNGFYAATGAEEKACPNLEVNILLKIEDVTKKIRDTGGEAKSPAEVMRLTKANMSEMEKSCNAQTGNRCDVVTLYSGEIFHLYQYKKYTDVRLVFAPENAIAMFGGDPDNFTFPRYCLDISFLRVYEDGKPVRPAHYLKWSKEGAKEGELTFVSGHPGSTGRLSTMAELQFARDISYPFLLEHLRSLIAMLLDYSKESEENRRIAGDELFSQQNSFKAYSGFLTGLREPSLMGRKKDEEATLRAHVDADAKLKQEYGKTWDEIAEAYRKYGEFYRPYQLLERTPAKASSLFWQARTLVRLADERKKPNGERLREFAETAIAAKEQFVKAETPIYASLEEVALTHYFEELQKHLGKSDPLVAKVMGGRSAGAAARDYVAGSRLNDAAHRRALLADENALRESKDSMLELARTLDPEARQLRKRFEDEVEGVFYASASRIAKIRFAKYGTEEYPDATFTLRFGYGPARGYTNAEGKAVPWATRFAGLFTRATGVAPFQVPEKWLAAKRRLNLKTPFNFVTTNDTHGGNSGSPTVNRKGEIVGILFDGNIEGLPNRFVYRDDKERSVHVASQGITEALRKVYGTRPLLRELGVISK